jgi:serine/threonine protein kinase/tetratricopeptide (TPR) repeat protein
VQLGRLTEPYAEWAAGTQVAIKTLHPEFQTDSVALAALDEELLAADEAKHPSLVRALFKGSDEHGQFLVFEYIAGRDLDELLADSGPLPEPRVRTIGADLAGALAALHAQGRTHGDLKLENARLNDAGHTVLIDLGFSRRVDLSRATDAATTHAGSLLYLAPETAHGEPPSLPSDVFALGLLLYMLATGSHPFIDPHAEEPFEANEADPFLQRLANLYRDGLSPASSIVVELSPFFDQLLERVLSPYPGLRPSAEMLCQLLEQGESHSWWRERVARSELLEGATDHPRAHLTQLVGRDSELRTLTEALNTLQPERTDQTAKGAVVWISSPAGSGKSRLVTEFAVKARTASNPPLYLYGRASERRESRPLGTLVSLLRRWLQLPPSASIGPAGIERLQRTVSPRDAETLVSALGQGSGDLPPALPSAIIAWLRVLAESKRLILFIDDLHHAGEATIATLTELARELSTIEILLILGIRGEHAPASPSAVTRFRYRLEELASRAKPLAFFTLFLGPLDEAAVDQLVDSRFAPSVPRRKLAHLLWERSLGSPGLIAEILRGLEARGDAQSISPSEGRWNLLISPESLPYPQSLKKAIEDRMAQLDPVSRKWLKRFSVIGGRISGDFVALAFPKTQTTELDQSFLNLTSADWLTPVGDRYRFSRPALREAIYKGIAPKSLAKMHSAIASALAKDQTDQSWEAIFHRAHHLRQANESDALLALLKPLFPKIPESGQPARILALTEWAIEAMNSETKPAPEEFLNLLEIAADAANQLGHRELERDLLDQMVDLDLDLESDPALAARVYLAHGRFSFGIGQLGLARGWLSNAAVFARRANSSELLSDALRRLAIVLAFAGEYEQARSTVKEALQNATDPQRKAFVYIADAQIAVSENRVNDSLEAISKARNQLTELPTTGLEGALASIDMLRARIFRSVGRAGRALASGSRAVRRAKRSGDRRLEVEATTRLAGLEIDLDRLDDAEEHLRDSRAVALEIEDKGGLALADIWLGILQWERNGPEARLTLERTAALAEEIGHYRLQAVALAVLARQRSSVGMRAAALEFAQRAIVLLERYGAELTDRVVIEGTLAMVLNLAGKDSDSRILIRKLKRRVRRESRGIKDESIRTSQRLYVERLLNTTLSAEGPLFPRIQLEQ